MVMVGGIIVPDPVPRNCPGVCGGDTQSPVDVTAGPEGEGSAREYCGRTLRALYTLSPSPEEVPAALLQFSVACMPPNRRSLEAAGSPLPFSLLLWCKGGWGSLWISTPTPRVSPIPPRYPSLASLLLLCGGHLTLARDLLPVPCEGTCPSSFAVAPHEGHRPPMVVVLLQTPGRRCGFPPIPTTRVTHM